ncbi:MAG TPA: DUF3857 domain-containing protein [Chitinophagaceae bacterium]|nr:DUF3857 domain-containing protein [Chitinophagaceae bacterium]
MYLSRIPALVIFLFLFSTYTTAQDKSNIKFGKISAADFEIKSTSIDSSADAVVISDIGQSEFEGNNKGYFSLKFKRHTRIKILNKNGADAANVNIYLYNNGNLEEKLDNVKGYTYNLENGKIVETKLQSESVFKDKLSKKWSTRKFTMPAVKEGSIIEYSYTIVSDFLFNLQPWEFQGKYPKLWSEYEVSIPEYFRYVFLSQGYSGFHINKASQENGKWTIVLGANSTERSETISLDGTINVNRWVMKDLPALKEEAYTSTVNNHIAKIQFQLASIKFPNSLVQNILGDWNKTAEDLMKGEDFGIDLNRANNWLDDEMRAITANAKDNLGKAKAIYTYVKDNFTSTSNSGLLIGDNLKTVFKRKNGNVAEINLLLTAMLRHEKIDARPVILSTKDHGYTNEIYPILDKFNYVVCMVNVGDKSYFLDAANTSLGFGLLHWKCYNGHARIIEEKQTLPVYFEPDSLRESKLTSVFVTNSEKGEWVGSLTSNPGTYESISIKENVKEKGLDAFFNKIKSAYNFDIKISNTGIDSLKKDATPVSVHYEFDMNLNKDEEIIYFNPLMEELYKENPFKSADRKYPVELPYAFDKIYVANIETPEGYEIDELPKSVRVNFNDDEGMFEYLIAKTEDGLQIRCRVKMNRASFSPEDYSSLREFYGFVVQKQNELVVYKKKK